MSKKELQKAQSIAIKRILGERTYQDRKWPGHQHTPAEWILILRKLVNDAEREWVTGHGDNSALHEVRQIAATALACLEQCGCPPRGEPLKGRKYFPSVDDLNPAG